VTDEDIDSELEDLARASNSTVDEAREKWKAMGLMAVIAEGVMHRRAVGWLMENVEAVEVDDSRVAEAGSEETAEDAEGTKKAAKKRATKKKETS
jgi:hypothetical protein